jgi:hypothetical protein
MSTCDGCRKEQRELVEGLCSECRRELGLPPGPVPVLRPPGPCRRCTGAEVVQCVLRERAEAGPRQAAASFGTEEVRFGMFARKPDFLRADAAQPIGLMLAYVCRHCGFTELYTEAPAQIPIGARHGTRLIEESEPHR